MTSTYKKAKYCFCFILLISQNAFSLDGNIPWHYQPSLLIETQHGDVLGTTGKNNTYVYKGIPYAAAPTGDLRWKAPQDPTPWGEPHDASDFGNICMQIGTAFGATSPDQLGSLIGSEDCLNLNVWRPNNNKVNLPVLVWIHGGSNTRGSSAQNIYNGANLANKANAIVVSINYRLGALGWAYSSFLNNDNPLDSSGNYALLDMIKALEWVETNIDNFGGNPNKVTVAGNSAGCASIWGLLHSPLAEHLMDRVFCSGSFPGSINTQAGQFLANSLVDNLFVAFGQATDLAAAAELRLNMSEEDIARFMRGVPAEVLALAVSNVPSNYIDGYVLPNDINIDSVKAGNFHKIPIMMGTTKNEASYILGTLIGFFNAKGGITDPLFWEQINADPRTLTITDIVDPAFYPVYQPLEEISSYKWNLVADNFTAAISQHKSPVFRYDFNWDELPAPWDEAFGATHTLDLAFMFGNFITEEDNPHKFAWTEENKQSREEISDKFIQYISTFMRTGRPLKTHKSPFWLRWNKWDTDRFDRRLVIDNPINTTNSRYTYDGYLELYNNLSPIGQNFMDNFMTGVPLEH